MGTFLRALAVAVAAGAIGAAAGTVRGQFAPPTPVENDAGSSAASPGAGITISPPVVPVDTSPEAAPARAIQTFTTDLLMGQVGHRPVFAQELFSPIDDKLKRAAQTSSNVNEFRSFAMALIQNELSNRETEILFQEMAEGALTQSDRDYVDRVMAIKKKDLLSEHGGSASAAQKALAASGSSIEKYMEEQRQDFIKSVYVSKNIVPRIKITRDMVMARYEKDPKRWQQPAQVELYMIDMRITKWLHEPTQNGEIGPVIAHPTPEQIKNAEDQALATARDLVGKLKAGADFGRLAEDYSASWKDTGGRAGVINKGALSSPELDKYVFSLPANTLGEPQLIRDKGAANTAVVIVKTGKKTEARTIPFAEAQGKIAEELESEQRRELWNQLVAKLQQKGSRERVEQMLGVAVDAAVTRYFVNKG